MNLRTEIQSFKKKAEGQTVFIIAGGPSLKDFDFSILKDKTCIALNSAYKGIPNLDAILWTDNDWAAKHYDNLMLYEGCKFQTRTCGDRFVNSETKGFANSCVLNKMNDYGFTMDINSVCGNNSGAQALNFVTNLKPYRIILLGYDMGYSKGRTHWHEGYEVTDASVYRNLFIPSINLMAPFIEKMGVDVVNCNENSNLECFRKDSLEKYL